MKRVVLTGATSGIGREVAVQLAAQGHHLILSGRDGRRGEELARTLDNARFVQADLSTRDGIGKLAASVDAVDVLVNNAGIMAPQRQATSEGVELNFAVHHLAPYSLTAALAVENLRVVNVNSEGHRAPMMGSGPVELDFDDLQSERSYDPFLAYSRSKLANLLFTYELQRRRPDMTVVALHPGLVKTNLGRQFPRLRVALVTAMGLSARRGAEPVTALAVDADVRAGQYYNRHEPVRSSAASYDTATARRLWEVTERLRGPFADL
ncbi:SDR family NAD(P)-dependent oxidoreductase [Nonomuraea roseoviolacea]|uniref:NAD(P)-dependent dehydrogenase (Short-subunit alcohol dehydrogenase family) n=1 Tax=Nonomuraea roseoviolacea subsp. carminata TaxID=160689 RepID=A0ABT1K1S4_9ACTN|nr:SDR family NAD(P)-dependent oxidoreductase [Nonomuraea roseoviolacea]MCP2347622.1 NAD(P)-dependent dehydrogenase (short-subunit alcohol dehydrogenase family) [Nonomuraea roseoviolacea subsp. carminata]